MRGTNALFEHLLPHFRHGAASESSSEVSLVSLLGTKVTWPNNLDPERATVDSFRHPFSLAFRARDLDSKGPLSSLPLTPRTIANHTLNAVRVNQGVNESARGVDSFAGFCKPTAQENVARCGHEPMRMIAFTIRTFGPTFLLSAYLLLRQWVGE
jgi:hypothetical protein